ncbi:MAG: class II aldolase/adducin family protein [Planctomycetes bacterium]|nr:class II aldolase/adducin family protein [Planctomycetota bacterium]
MPNRKVSSKIVKTFKKIGWASYVSGLNTSHSGNMSIRQGDKIHITRRGAMKGFLEPADIVTISLKPSDRDKLASSEARIHRAIYNKTNARAVMHCHPLMATVLSLKQDKIVPLDVEGNWLLPEIPVLECREPTGSDELARKLSALFTRYKAAIVRSHGVFAIGETLDEAFRCVAVIEHSAWIIYDSR